MWSRHPPSGKDVDMYGISRKTARKLSSTLLEITSQIMVCAPLFYIKSSTVRHMTTTETCTRSVYKKHIVTLKEAILR